MGGRRLAADLWHRRRLVRRLQVGVARHLEDLVGVGAAGMEQAEPHLLADVGDEHGRRRLVKAGVAGPADRWRVARGEGRVTDQGRYGVEHAGDRDGGRRGGWGGRRGARFAAPRRRVVAVVEHLRRVVDQVESRSRRGHAGQVRVVGSEDHELMEGVVFPGVVVVVADIRLDTGVMAPVRSLRLDDQAAEKTVQRLVERVGRQQIGGAELDRDVLGLGGVVRVDVLRFDVPGIPGVGDAAARRRGLRRIEADVGAVAEARIGGHQLRPQPDLHRGVRGVGLQLRDHVRGRRLHRLQLRGGDPGAAGVVAAQLWTRARQGAFRRRRVGAPAVLAQHRRTGLHEVLLRAGHGRVV